MRVFEAKVEAKWIEVARAKSAEEPKKIGWTGQGLEHGAIGVRSNGRGVGCRGEGLGEEVIEVRHAVVRADALGRQSTDQVEALKGELGSSVSKALTRLRGVEELTNAVAIVVEAMRGREDALVEAI
ncbi:hypothetical protein ACLOJK_012591 [Asimina triloba]